VVALLASLRRSQQNERRLLMSCSLGGAGMNGENSPYRRTRAVADDAPVHRREPPKLIYVAPWTDRDPLYASQAGSQA